MIKWELLLGTGIAVLVFLVIIGINIFPIVVLIGLAGLGLFLVGRSKGKVSVHGTKTSDSGVIPPIDFDDIGGHERAKHELKEALDFIRYRDKIKKYGIRPLKGILLAGPPGTGKTLMAKASAHYTDSVFLSASGSEFIEMYVGVGAQRVRDLFKKARRLAEKEKKRSAILFIDEIDVIGGKRNGDSHREYDQTLNQLLTEMDGIKTNETVQVLVVAATNRKDMLDDALLRPGRFDRHIQVDLPDKKARKQILAIHMKAKPVDPAVNLQDIAQETFGFSGAQLETVCNEAAIYALREGVPKISLLHIRQAIDKVMLGERMDREANELERKRVAIHELGHAIIAEINEPGSVAEVSLTSRGGALGYVRHYPQEDRYLYTEKQLEDQIMVCLGGAAAESIVFGMRSTGARNDYEKAIHLAEVMIESGLSDLGVTSVNKLPADKLHGETKKILDRLYQITEEQLRKYQALFGQCYERLLQEERMSGQEFRQLLAASQPDAHCENRAG